MALPSESPGEAWAAAVSCTMVMQRVEEWGIRGLSRLAAHFIPTPPRVRHLQVGLKGELEALLHLQRRGDTVVARRWTSAKVRGDLDLIAWQGATLCFIEVKSRTAHDFVAAETAVDRSKRQQLRQLARVYLSAFPEPARANIITRFDVVSIYMLPSGTQFEVMQSAFGWSE